MINRSGGDLTSSLNASTDVRGDGDESLLSSPTTRGVTGVSRLSTRDGLSEIMRRYGWLPAATSALSLLRDVVSECALTSVENARQHFHRTSQGCVSACTHVHQHVRVCMYICMCMCVRVYDARVLPRSVASWAPTTIDVTVSPMTRGYASVGKRRDINRVCIHVHACQEFERTSPCRSVT